MPPKAQQLQAAELPVAAIHWNEPMRVRALLRTQTRNTSAVPRNNRSRSSRKKSSSPRSHDFRHAVSNVDEPPGTDYTIVAGQK